MIKGKVLPPNWHWVDIREAVGSQIETFDKKTYRQPEFTYIDISSIDNAAKQIVAAKRIQTHNAPSRATYIVRTNDILVATVRPNLNAVARVELGLDGAVCSSGFCVLRFGEKYCADYFFNFFVSPQFIAAVTSLVQGAMYPAISDDDVKAFRVPAPIGIEEQQEVAAQLELRRNEFFAMRSAAERQVEAMSALPDSLLRAALFQRDPPEKWTTTPLSELCDINPLRPRTLDRNSEAGTTFIPMEAVDDATGIVASPRIRPFGEVQRGYTYFEEGDIIFAKITPCMQNGKTAIVTGLKGGFGFGSTEFHVLRCKAGVDRRWVYHLLRSAEFRKQAEDNFEGSAGQRRVPDGFLKKVKVPFWADTDSAGRLLETLDRQMETVYRMRENAERQQEAVSAIPAATLREFFNFSTSRS